MNRRVVITGMGAITPVGLSAKETWTNVRNGVVGIAPIETLDTEERQVKVAGEVKGFEPTEIMDKMEARRSARFTQFAIKAALEAFEQSGLDMAQENALRFGVNIGSGIGSLQLRPNLSAVRADGHREHGGRFRCHPLGIQGKLHLLRDGLRIGHQLHRRGLPCHQGRIL